MFIWECMNIYNLNEFEMYLFVMKQYTVTLFFNTRENKMTQVISAASLLSLITLCECCRSDSFFTYEKLFLRN